MVMPDHRSRRYEARDYLGVDHPLLEGLRTAPLVRTPRFLTLSLTFNPNPNPDPDPNPT